jgi:dihydroorotase
VHRDISLAEQTGGRLHIQHVSCGESVARLREARRRGVRVTAEVTPHHLALTDADVQPANPDFKMMPPLRSEQDRQALIEAVAAGTVSALATDHAPHRPADKAGGFLAAAPGIAGLETAVGITYSLLVKSGRLSLADWLRLWTAGPASVLDLPCPSLAPGQPADVCVLDLDSEWTVRSAEFLSRSRNTPFEGWKLVGRAVYTFCGGVMTFRLPARPDH